MLLRRGKGLWKRRARGLEAWLVIPAWALGVSFVPACRVEISTSGCVLCLGRTYLVIRVLCIWFCIAYLVKPYLDIVLKVQVKASISNL